LGQRHSGSSDFQNCFCESELALRQAALDPCHVTHLAYKLQLNLEQMKAFSQNIGHDSMLTTLCSYVPVSPERQAEIIRTLGQPDGARNGDMAAAIAMQVVAMMKK
jgi:hypothetical protein